MYSENCCPYPGYMINKCNIGLIMSKYCIPSNNIGINVIKYRIWKQLSITVLHYTYRYDKIACTSF